MHDRCLTINTPVYLCNLINMLVEPYSNLRCVVKREDKTIKIYRQYPNTPIVEELTSVKYKLDPETLKYVICF